MKRKRNKLCIIGSAPSKADAPYADEGFDIWAISGAAFSESLGDEKKPNVQENGWNTVHRIDALFEMHKREKFQEKIEKINACRVPVVMQKHEADIPKSEPFPANEIAREIGEDYSCSIAYMLAYAIWLGYDEIRLYGVILLHKTEYVRQRPGVKYYLGIARAFGINVWAPDETGLTKPLWRYGYDDHDAICAQIMDKKATIDDDIKNQTKLIEVQTAVLRRLEGAQITCENLISEIKGGLA